MHSQQNNIFQSKQKDHFSKLFPELDPLFVNDQDLKKLSDQMKESIGSKESDSRVISNGVSIFSQFLAHDMTFESTSKLGNQNAIGSFQNDRTINLDLDCIYGQKTQDFLYNAEDKDKMLLGKCFQDHHYKMEWFDLQRNSQGKAIIPDARNDENIIVSRLQVLFIEFHNRMVDHLRSKGRTGSAFNEAKKQVIWYYHWLIIYEYLYKIMDWNIFEELMDNGSKYFINPNSLPLEFTGAAFRTGHSQTRDLNRINEKVEKRLFELGFFTEMKELVDWRYMFNFGDGRCQFAKLIDTKIGNSFHSIPFIKSDDPYEKSLPFRNLKRGVVYGLPSGEDVANRMGFEPIKVPETEHLSGTPLWFYILKEAELQGHEGEHLGRVGSTILGECFLTVLRNDDYSFLKLHPKWKPTLGKDIGEFDFLDLIRFVHQN